MSEITSRAHNSGYLTATSSSIRGLIAATIARATSRPTIQAETVDCSVQGGTTTTSL